MGDAGGLEAHRPTAAVKRRSSEPAMMKLFMFFS